MIFRTWGSFFQKISRLEIKFLYTCVHWDLRNCECWQNITQIFSSPRFMEICTIYVSHRFLWQGNTMPAKICSKSFFWLWVGFCWLGEKEKRIWCQKLLYMWSNNVNFPNYLLEMSKKHFEPVTPPALHRKGVSVWWDYWFLPSKRVGRGKLQAFSNRCTETELSSSEEVYEFIEFETHQQRLISTRKSR